MLLKVSKSLSVFSTKKKVIINDAVHEVMLTTYVLVV